MKNSQESFAPKEDGGDARGRTAKATLFYGFVKSTMWLILKTFFRLRVHGAGNLPREGGVLVASNHQSYLDPVIVTVAFRRPIAFMARDTLFKNPLFGRLISALNAFPVRRHSADIGAMREAVHRLQSGNVLLVFPESERTHDGRIGEMRGGPVILAHRAGAPIVPVVIKGAFEAWPRTRKLPRFRRLSITCGPPIPPPADGKRESHERVLQQLQQSFEALGRES